MTDTHLLRYFISKNGDTIAGLADSAGISRTALSAKMNNRAEFKQSEIAFIVNRYKISGDMVVQLFCGGVTA